jgi:hypothetical protein
MNKSFSFLLSSFLVTLLFFTSVLASQIARGTTDVNNTHSPPPINQIQMQSNKTAMPITGTIYVQVNGGNKTAKDFTLKLVSVTGQGTVSPDVFRGSESGTKVAFSGNAAAQIGYRFAINQDPNYYSTFGSDCQPSGIFYFKHASFTPGQTFTCHVIFHYRCETIVV